MWRRTLVVLVAIASLTGSAFGQTYWTYGEGSESCGYWTTARANKDTRASLIIGAWVLGFTSGAGWSGRRLAHTDTPGIEGWMDNYCRANPLKTVSEGAVSLIGELTVK